MVLWIAHVVHQEIKKVWQLLLDKLAQDVMIEYDAHHFAVVVERQEGLEQRAQHPERFFLTHNTQQTTHDKVEALTVADFGVSDGVCKANAPQLLDDLFRSVELFTRERAAQIHLNLMLVRVRERPVIVVYNVPITLTRMLGAERGHGVQSA